MNPPDAPARRIFLVEDHPLMREVVRDYLGAVPGLEVCGESVSAEDALERLEAARPDLVLVDTSLPRMSGIDLVGEVRARWADLPCLMLSGHDRDGYVQRAFDAGARGYVLKGDPAELPRAIHEVLDGLEYLSPRLRPAREGQPVSGPLEG